MSIITRSSCVHTYIQPRQKREHHARLRCPWTSQRYTPHFRHLTNETLKTAHSAGAYDLYLALLLRCDIQFSQAGYVTQQTRAAHTDREPAASQPYASGPSHRTPSYSDSICPRQLQARLIHCQPNNCPAVSHAQPVRISHTSRGQYTIPTSLGTCRNANISRVQHGVFQAFDFGFLAFGLVGRLGLH